MLEKTHVEKTIKEYGRGRKDTGSPEVQIALLTDKIQKLTDHVGSHTKDFSSRRGLLGLVSQRRQLLSYLRRSNEGRYVDVVKKLGLRK